MRRGDWYTNSDRVLFIDSKHGTKLFAYEFFKNRESGLWGGRMIYDVSNVEENFKKVTGRAARELEDIYFYCKNCCRGNPIVMSEGTDSEDVRAREAAAV